MKNFTKKCLFVLILIFALIKSAIAAVVIDNIISPNGMVSFKTRSSVPSNNYTVIGMPIQVGLYRLNEFLSGVSPTEHAYLVFGYFDIQTQDTTWFPETCKVTLDKNKNITVEITKINCTIE